MSVITRERLKEVVRYDAITGVFTWRVSPRARTKAGDVAGSKRDDGYITIKIDGVSYLAHRLAFLYAHGHWPAGQLDHINHDQSDNSLINLRDVDNRINLENQTRAHRDSSTKLLGITPSRGKFSARITVGGKAHFIGRFDTAEKAHSEYVKAKRLMHVGNTL